MLSTIATLVTSRTARQNATQSKALLRATTSQITLIYTQGGHDANSRYW
ncbi:hypothetical protein MADA3029_1220042 [Vibrio nigripulchritudo MADA3029]|nr:hypothetical protein VIBNIMADA3020_800042 [Vibrio nigripulchritudo MADA3020]CCN55304.1 hypothetical protein VIBNIMADA3021_740023 [Vibrio nigripulchritudo MADA3021]CCN57989.1 hypothetical protein MADA3029_1220042 [Vibrio nigripulchritudo MADA3029]